MSRTWQQKSALKNLRADDEDGWIDDEIMAGWYDNPQSVKKGKTKSKKERKKERKKEQRKNAKKLVRVGMNKENIMAYAFHIEDNNPQMGLFDNSVAKKSMFDNILIQNMEIGHYWKDIIKALDITEEHKAALIEYYEKGIRNVGLQPSPESKGEGSRKKRRRSRRRRRKKTKKKMIIKQIAYFSIYFNLFDWLK
jgi:hypothetical protein